MHKLVNNEDYYFDESGLMIFTENYLLQKGECCGNGCRHCPFNYKNVPEKKRNILLTIRNKSIENKK